MIIELVGLPGSGKTTFAKRLAEDGEWTVVSIEETGELLFYNTLFLFRHPVSFFYGLYFLYRYRGLHELWYTKFTNLFLVHNAKYMKASVRAKKYPRAIIDQGHHQNIISLFDTPVADDVVDRYVRLLPKPDLLCFFVADTKTRTERLKERGYGARGELDENYREAWEKAREIHFEHLYVSRASLSFATETVSPEDAIRKREVLTHARFWYVVMHARMPTEKAHGLQIAKSVEALTRKGIHATLWLPRRRNPIEKSITEYYDLRVESAVRYFVAPDFLRLPRWFGSLRFSFDAFGFFLALLFTRIDREGVFFTRNPELAWLFKMKGASVFYEAHLFPSSKLPLLKFFLHSVDGIIANSDGTADAFAAHGFQHVQVVRNGVDIERFTAVQAREEARALLDLPKEKTIIMYVGAFYEWKGVLLLLEAWEKHFGGRNDLLLVLVGGSANDLIRFGASKADAELPNVFFVEHIPSAKIPVYLSASDMLVLPNMPTTEESIRYTSPIKLFEYMASGRPIIASDLPSIREVLSPETALLCKAGDVDALALGIENLLRSPRDARERSERARTMVHTYSWDARAQLLLNIVRGSTRNRPNTHRQFLQSIVAGGFMAVFYLMLVYVFTEYLGLWYMLSVFLAYACALVANFSLLKAIFVGGVRKTTHELFLYATLVIANFFFNEFASYLLVEKLHLWYMLAQLLIVGTLAIANFFAYRSHVFQKKKQ